MDICSAFEPLFLKGQSMAQQHEDHLEACEKRTQAPPQGFLKTCSARRAPAGSEAHWSLEAWFYSPINLEVA